MPIDQTLRNRISTGVSRAMEPLPQVLAGWEGGSAAFEQIDEYSDIDLTFLVTDDATFEELYAGAEKALEQISPIALRHDFPIGRYYQLHDCGDFLLVDLVLLRQSEPDLFLEPERHGKLRPLFDKAQWLVAKPSTLQLSSTRREKRYREIRAWYVLSQNFVRKAIWRGRDVEAISAFWGYTIRPLVELLRMHYCPARWDFGMRYLERDLPADVCNRVRQLVYVQSVAELEPRILAATNWATELFHEELHP